MLQAVLVMALYSNNNTAPNGTVVGDYTAIQHCLHGQRFNPNSRT